MDTGNASALRSSAKSQRGGDGPEKRVSSRASSRPTNSRASGRSKLPKISRNWPTPLCSYPPSRDSTNTGASASRPTTSSRPTTWDSSALSHGAQASSAQPSQTEGNEGESDGASLQRRAREAKQMANAERTLLAVELQETDKLLASNLEKQNALVTKRRQRRIAHLLSETEPSLEAWLDIGGFWCPGTPLPAPRWPSFSPTQSLPDLTIGGGSSASRARPEKSRSSTSLVNTAARQPMETHAAPEAAVHDASASSDQKPSEEELTPRAREAKSSLVDAVIGGQLAGLAEKTRAAEQEESAKTKELLNWMRGIMSPHQQPAPFYHLPLASLAPTAKALREMRQRRRHMASYSASFEDDEQASVAGGIAEPKDTEAEGMESIAGVEDEVQASPREAWEKSHPSAEEPMQSSEDATENASPSVSFDDGDILTKSCSTKDARSQHLEDKRNLRHRQSMSVVEGALGESYFGEDKRRAKRGLEVNRHKALEAFRRLAKGGEIDSSDLVQVLHFSGHTKVDPEFPKRVMEEKFRGRSTLDREDFLEFIAEYEEYFRRYIEDIFNRADMNGSGSLSAAEISTMLRRIGITPTPGVAEELLLEVTGVDNCLAEVNVDQFVAIHDIMHERAGFTSSEVAQIKALFYRYDRDKSGSIDGRELRAALSWWGFAVRSEVTEEFISEVDFDNSGNSDFHAFLQVMRKHRELELEKIHNAFGVGDSDHSGSIDEKELPAVFTRLGYTTGSPAVIRECTKTCGVNPNEPMIFEDLFLLVEEFRQTEGFLQSELEDIKEVFQKHADETGTSIGGVELASAIRWLGYPQTFEQVQEILEQFDIDDSCRLEYSEFLKMLRRYRELEVEKIHSLFEEDDSGTGQIDVRLLRVLLLSLGHTPTVKEVTELWKNDGSRTSTTFWELDALVSCFRKEARKRFRENCGFSDREVLKLQTSFNRNDPFHTGNIENRHLANLLKDVFPDSEYDLESHARAKEILRTVDADGDGKLNFKEFLALMRIVQDQADADTLAKEQKAVEACKFPRSEVAELRKVFQMFDMDASGDLSFSEFIGMIEAIVPIKGNQRGEELQKMLAEGDEDGNRALSFPEFLQIMRKIQDQNWHGINDLTGQKH